MKLGIMQIFWTISLFFFVFSGFINGQILKGKVLDEDGKPLADVIVHPAGYIFSEKTEKNGEFKIEFPSSFREKKVIIFEKYDGFEVKTVIVEDLSKPISIALNKREKMNEVLRDCPVETKKLELIGDFVKLPVNKKEFKIKRKYFEHGVSWKLKLKKNKESSYISGIDGTAVVGGRYPSSFQLLRSENYSLRYRSGFLDWKGQEEDGTFWRQLGGGSFATFFSYSTKSKEAAEIFDKIFDEACS